MEKYSQHSEDAHLSSPRGLKYVAGVIGIILAGACIGAIGAFIISVVMTLILGPFSGIDGSWPMVWRYVAGGVFVIGPISGAFFAFMNRDGIREHFSRRHIS